MRDLRLNDEIPHCISIPQVWAITVLAKDSHRDNLGISSGRDVAIGKHDATNWLRARSS